MTAKKPTKAQRAKTIKELNDIISLRNHIYTLVNGPRTSLITREEERELRQFTNQLDREVVEKSLEMSKPPEEPKPVIPQTATVLKQATAVKAKEEEVKEKGGKVTTDEKPRKVGAFRRVTE